MIFIFALAFAVLLLLAGWWGSHGAWAALLVGAGLGAWLQALVDKRIRRITEERAPAKPDDVYAALGDIHWRLKRLEEEKGLGASPLEQAADKADQAHHTAAAETVFELDPRLTADTVMTTLATPEKTETVAHTLPPGTEKTPAFSARTRSNWPEENAPASTGDNLIERARAWLLGGNTVVRVGIVILFFGVAFLLKFAAEHAVIPLEMRVAGVGLGAVVLLVIGWRLRLQREAYALALQGAGVGLLYLTLFGAFRLYALVPPLLALAAMVAVSALSALLAVVQNSRALICIAVIGGFLAPVLASTGGGNHVVLFSYYAILNIGIFAVAWFKAWRPLNLLGFFFTFGIGMTWGARAYQPELFGSTEPFLLLFFALFLGIAILFAGRQASASGPEQKTETPSGIRFSPRIVDSTLVFGLPLVAFGFQAELTKGMPFALAYSALALAALYLGLARWLQGRARPDLHLLTESFLALGVIFATLAIPLALDARWTSASWALEGAALVWLGLRQQRLLARTFGLLLQLAAAAAYFNRAPLADSASIPLLNAACTGGVLIALAAFFTAWQLQTYLKTGHGKNLRLWERDGAVLIFFWALAWWLQTGFAEAGRLLDDEYSKAFALIFPALTAVTLSALQRKLNWEHARLPAAGLMLFLLGVFAVSVMDDGHPLSDGGWLAWPLALLMHFWLLRRYDRECFQDWFAWVHALGFWLLAAIGAWELHWLAHQNGLLHDSWSAAAVIVVPGLLLLWASRPAAQTSWPLHHQLPSYLGWGAWPLVAGLAGWCVFTDFSNAGNASPLPYFPLLNPVDLGHVFVLLVSLQWLLQVRRHPDALPQHDRQQMLVAAGVLGFIWLNAMLLRSIHQWLDIPYTLRDLFGSMLVQAALSLFWSLIALTLMLTGTRRVWRSLWLLGAALMAVVVAKLFFVDLGSIASVARIVSFIGVGLLMLLIGYVAPVPPDQEKTDAAAEATQGAEKND